MIFELRRTLENAKATCVATVVAILAFLRHGGFEATIETHMYNRVHMRNIVAAKNYAKRDY